MFSVPEQISDIPVARQFARNLILTAGYAAVLALLIWLVATLTGKPLLSEQAFLNWDTEHYNSIRANGYTFMTTAFFPLFPWLWRILGVSARGMAAVNLGGFIGVFSLLSTWFRWSWQELLLAVSVPMLCFMGLTYSEALFFLGGALVLRGWQKQQLVWLGLGLLLCGLTRSTAFVLAPAVVCTAYLTRSSGRQFLTQAAVGIGASGAGLLLSVYAHFLDTGRWFAFFEAQRQIWNNRLRWPSLPLSSWGGDFSTRCEAVTLLFALAASIYLVRLVLKQTAKQPAEQWAPVLFSLLYVAGVTVITVATKGGGLISLGRYVWATPFGLLPLVWLLRTLPATTLVLAKIMGLAQLCWLLLFASYGHIHTLLMYGLTGAYVVLILANAHPHPTVRRVALLATLLINTGLFVRLYCRFLQHEWVG